LGKDRSLTYITDQHKVMLSHGALVGEAQEISYHTAESHNKKHVELKITFIQDEEDTDEPYHMDLSDDEKSTILHQLTAFFQNKDKKSHILYKAGEMKLDEKELLERYANDEDEESTESTVGVI
jgi:hypothetical protein